MLSVGDIVNVGLFKEPGIIVELWATKNCVSIHYDGFDKMYDEYVGLEDIYGIDGGKISISKVTFVPCDINSLDDDALHSYKKI